jgi:hypothetical protein
MKRKVFLIVLFGLAISLAGMQLAEATPVVFDLNF